MSEYLNMEVVNELIVGRKSVPRKYMPQEEKRLEGELMKEKEFMKECWIGGREIDETSKMTLIMTDAEE